METGASTEYTSATPNDRDYVYEISRLPDGFSLPWESDRVFTVEGTWTTPTREKEDVYSRLHSALHTCAERILKDYSHTFSINVREKRPYKGQIKVLFPLESNPQTVTVPAGIKSGAINCKKTYAYRCETNPREYTVKYVDSEYGIDMTLHLKDGHPLFKWDEWRNMINNENSQYAMTPHLTGE